MKKILSGSSERKMHPVAVFPTREIGTDPGEIRAFAQGVESMGFHSILTYDHLVGTREETGNNHYNYRDAFHEPLTLFAYIAGATERIGLMTGVIVLPQRETILVAKQAVEVANLSEGRLHIGIGVGSNPEEFAVLGKEFHTRGSRIEEQLRLLRGLWTNEKITYTETSNNVEPYGINPRPLYEIPIWMGGWSDAAIKRTARLADGWMPMGHPEDIEPRIGRLRQQLTENGRDPETFPILGAFGRQYSLDGGEKRSLPSANNMEEFDRLFPQLQRLCLTHVAFGSMRFGFQGVDEHLKYLERRKQWFDKLQADTQL